MTEGEIAVLFMTEHQKADQNNMRTYILTVLLAAMLVAAVPLANAQVSLGIRIGPPPPARVVVVQSPRPGPEFAWVDGYWYPVGRHYKWHAGYWTRPPYEGG